MHLIPITETPSVHVVAAPPLSSRAEAEVLHWRREITANGSYDGPKLLALAASKEELVVYRATYSARLAHRALADKDGTSPFGLGSLGCWLLLRRPDGTILLAKRTDKMVISPGLWAGSVSCGVNPGETPDEAIRREMQEELSLSLSEISGLRPVAVCIGPDPVGCCVLFTGLLRDEAGLSPNPDEVSELCFAQADNLPTPTTPDLANLIAVCNRAENGRP